MSVLQPAPRFAAFDVTDGGPVYLIVACYLRVFARVLSDRKNVTLLQNCSGIPVSTRSLAMRCTIFDVFLRGIPAQVGYAIVCLVAIVVTSLSSVRRVANECKQYQAMNLRQLHHAVSVKIDPLVSVAICNLRQVLTFLEIWIPGSRTNEDVSGSDVAKVANFIVEPADLAPFFLHYSPPSVNSPCEARGNWHGYQRSAAKPSRAGEFYYGE